MAESARQTVEIARLGAAGDGVAETPEARTFVPLALPGETWTRADPTAPWQALTTSPDRIEPTCVHVHDCGGCQAQHMAPRLYAAWKRDIVRDAFRHRGLDPAVAELVAIPTRSRRRAALTGVRTTRGVVLGYREEAGQTIVDVLTCEVLKAPLLAILPLIREILALLLDIGAEARCVVTETASGIDLIIDGASRSPTADARAAIARLATEVPLARVVVDREEIVLLAEPMIAIDGARVPLPAGVFVQAVAEAEAALTARVLEGVGKAKRIVDLFCGLGTFALPLARRARVTALDSDPLAIQALEHGARHAQGLKPIDARRRDLFREPYSRLELRDFDAAVLDPPRAGAKAQADMLAKSAVPRIVYVSCNPATLARDCRTLVDGGYRIDSVTPIDQFLFASHVECVAVLERSPAGSAQRPSRRAT